MSTAATKAAGRRRQRVLEPSDRDVSDLLAAAAAGVCLAVFAAVLVAPAWLS